VPLDPGLVAFVTAALPPAPARLLEVGAGQGELAEHLRDSGHDVVAIDPAGRTPAVRPVALDQLDEPVTSFDAALAVVSLHHVNPLDTSCEHLAEMLKPGAPLVVDEFDSGAFDVAVAAWWLANLPAHEHAPGSAQEIADNLQGHVYPLSRVLEALEPWFELGPVERGPYLHRWKLGPAALPLEEDAIARGQIPATGARLVGRRR
jgi:SAM-dependent methyltransferase